MLLDRLCLSLTLAKPVGLAAWASANPPASVRAAVVDLTGAATHTIALAAGALRNRSAPATGLSRCARKRSRARRARQRRRGTPDSPGMEGTTALLAMLAERDYGTCCHSKATAEWARRLATAMDCNAETSEFIALCALLHDIGKISTPDHVLLKPSALDSTSGISCAITPQPERASLIRSRRFSVAPSSCGRITNASTAPAIPTAFSASSIPFEARVVAVADAFHAMISERPYRQPIAPRQALKVLQDGRGSQWDPDVVDAMLGMFCATHNDRLARAYKPFLCVVSARGEMLTGWWARGVAICGASLVPVEFASAIQMALRPAKLGV